MTKRNKENKERRGFDLVKFIVIVIIIYSICLYILIQGVELAFAK